MEGKGQKAAGGLDEALGFYVAQFPLLGFLAWHWLGADALTVALCVFAFAGAALYATQAEPKWVPRIQHAADLAWLALCPTVAAAALGGADRQALAAFGLGLPVALVAVFFLEGMAKALANKGDAELSSRAAEKG